MVHDAGSHDGAASAVQTGAVVLVSQKKNRYDSSGTPSIAGPPQSGTTAEAGGPGERTAGRNLPVEFPLCIEAGSGDCGGVGTLLLLL